jgi:type I restriction enzyme S subunit
VTLRDICEEETGTRDPQAEPDRTFRYVDITSVDNRKKRIIEARSLRGLDAPSRARQVIRAGDVLVSTTRPNLNAVAIVPTDLDDEVCSTGFCVLRAREELLPDFLFACVRHEGFVAALSDLVKGALYPAVTDGQVRAQSIPLPPLPEQKRIAVTLNEQLATVERAHDAAQAQLDDAEALPAAYFREVFPTSGQPLPAGWRWVKLGELGWLTDGDWILNVDYAPSGVRLLQVGDVGVGRFVGKSSRYVTMQRASELGCTLLEAGDILISRMPDPIGRACVLPELGYPCITAVDVSIFRPSAAKADTGFLAAYFCSPDWLRRVLSKASGATRPRISRSNLESLSLPLPDVAEQKRIAAALGTQTANTEKARLAVEALLADIGALPAALLRRGFSGEL